MDGERFQVDPPSVSARNRRSAFPGILIAQHEMFRSALATVDDARRVEALGWFLPRFQAHYDWLLQAPRPRYDARIADPNDRTLRTIQEDGYAFRRIDPAIKERLSGLTQALADNLATALDRQPKPKFMNGMVALDRNEHPKVHRLIERAYAQAGLWEIASAYAGEPVVLGGVGLQVNTPHTTLYRHGHIDAAGIPDFRTGSLHMDSGGWPHLKVIIYLSDVGLDQGPLRYMRGSHRWADTFELAVRKAHDKHKTPPDYLMALPEPFRMLATFGAYMDPDGPEADALLASEHVLSGDDGSDLIIFDYHGGHRGGFVRSGRRRILQCSFAPADPNGPAARAAAASQGRF